MFLGNIIEHKSQRKIRILTVKGQTIRNLHEQWFSSILVLEDQHFCHTLPRFTVESKNSPFARYRNFWSLSQDSSCFRPVFQALLQKKQRKPHILDQTWRLIQTDPKSGDFRTRNEIQKWHGMEWNTKTAWHGMKSENGMARNQSKSGVAWNGIRNWHGMEWNP